MARRLQEPGHHGERRGDKHGREIRQHLQGIILGPACSRREIQRQVLQSNRRRIREDIPGHRNETMPLIGRKKENIKEHSVHHPEQIQAEVPPAGETDCMTDSGQTQPPG